MFKNILTVVTACTMTMFGCSGEQLHDNPEDETLEIIDNLIEAGFPPDDIQIYDGVVYVGNDAAVSLAASREMLEVDDSGSVYKQYRTNNLVSRSLDAICINGSAFTGTLSTALNWSINNYNALNLTFTMYRTSGSTSGCDAVITARVVSGSGGSAGFPSGGRPYPYINIGAGVASYGTNTAEHVITHELGHTLGFRHSDYFNRSISCGRGGNEGGGSVGANHVPGTPTGASVGGSIMNACFRSRENGEFTSSDRAALQYLY